MRSRECFINCSDKWQAIIQFPQHAHRFANFRSNCFDVLSNVKDVSNIWLCIKPETQEWETECGERGEWGNVIFRGMFNLNILGNVAKYFGECSPTFQGVLPNILGNVLKHSRESPQTFRGMSSNISVNVLKHSGECSQRFWGMLFFFLIPCLTSIPIYYLQIYNSTVNLDSQTN